MVKYQNELNYTNNSLYIQVYMKLFALVTVILNYIDRFRDIFAIYHNSCIGYWTDRVKLLKVYWYIWLSIKGR